MVNDLVLLVGPLQPCGPHPYTCTVNVKYSRCIYNFYIYSISQIFAKIYMYNAIFFYVI